MPPRGRLAAQAQPSGVAALAAVITGSRSSGSLNLAGRSLDEVPRGVYILDEELPGCEVKWWEMVELSKLDLSRNNLKTLPEELFSLGSLTYMDVSCNELRSLPKGLEQLEQLKTLDVSKNPLAALPDSIARLPSLVTLSSSNCGLSALPSGLGNRNLAVLNAAGNSISSLPASLANCSALIKLDLQNNCLQDLPGRVLAGLVSLQELQLSGNQLHGQLPPELGGLARLRLLWLRDNNLTELPASIAGCTSLIELHAGFNQISRVPDELAHCRLLRVLDLRNNKVPAFPDACCTLELNLLDLTNNSIRTINPRLGLMTSLRSLPLDGNPTKIVRRELLAGPISALLEHLRTKLSEEELEVDNHRVYRTSSGASGAGAAALARQGSGPGASTAPAAAPKGLPTGRGSAGGWKIGAAASGNLFGADEHRVAAENARKVAAGGVGGQEMVLAGRGLRQVPEEVWAAGEQVIKLDLSCNQLGNLPPQALLAFANLRTLLLKSLGMTAWPLPPAPGALPRLADLQASHNPIKSLPAHALAACPNLRNLELANVPGAAFLPAGCLAAVAQLETLDLAQTGCSEIGSELLAAGSLRVLNLNGNRISSLPVELTGLTRLEELHVTNNSISSLPPQLGLMAPTLRVLALEGNVLRAIRRPLLERGTDALLAYLRDRIPA